MFGGITAAAYAISSENSRLKWHTQWEQLQVMLRLYTVLSERKAFY